MAFVAPRPASGDPLWRGVLDRLWAERVRLIAISLAAGLLALGAAFLLPDWFRSQATILPPEGDDMLSTMSLAQRALTKFPAFGILSDYSSAADVYKAILNSRTLQDRIIDRFDLGRVYKLKSREKTEKEFKGHYAVKLNVDGTI